jgi:hypothetical protein
MATQTMTLNVPDPLYRHLEFLARQARRTVEEEAVEMLAATLPDSVSLSPDLAEVLDSLTLLDDAALSQAAGILLPETMSAEMECLHLQRQRDGHSEADVQRLADLVRHYERTVLVRAQAAALLKERGHDPGQFPQP